MPYLNKRGGAVAPLILEPAFIVAIVLGVIFLGLLYKMYTLSQGTDYEKAYLANRESLLVSTLGALPATANVELLDLVPVRKGNYSLWLNNSKLVAFERRLSDGFTGYYLIPANFFVDGVPKNISAKNASLTGPRGYSLFKEGARLRFEGKEIFPKKFNPHALVCPEVRLVVGSVGIDAAYGYDPLLTGFTGDVRFEQQGHVTRFIAAALINSMSVPQWEATRELKNLPLRRTFLPPDRQTPQRVTDRIAALQMQQVLVSIGVGNRKNIIIAYVNSQSKKLQESMALACNILNRISDEMNLQGTAIVPIELDMMRKDDPQTQNIDEADARLVLQGDRVGVFLEIGALNDGLTSEAQSARVAGRIAEGLGGRGDYARIT